MLNSNMLLSLYTRVLEDTSFANDITEDDIKQAIENMHKDYKGSPDSLNKTLNGLTDFNEVAHRCAYLFKYAPFHTALTYKAMSHALSENSYELQAMIDSLSGPLKICSLGGGPGADAIGAIAAMHTQFGFFRSYLELVDIMSEWELTFSSVLDELRQQNYGSLSESMSEKWFDWSFMTADLQSKMSRELTEVLRTADVVTMIKFVSAAASKNTSSMIEKIFKIMKPGAFVLFIDNAGGGFKELISSAAQKYKFTAVSTPLKHQPYINECFNNLKYGYRSCYEVKVAVQLLMKSGPINYSREDNLITNRSCNQNFTLSLAAHWQNVDVPPVQNFRFNPKPVHNLMNETFETPSPSNWHGRDFPPSTEFSPRLNRLREQINSPENFNKSFESPPFWSSTPQALTSPSWHVRNENSWHECENESFGNDLSLNAHCSNEIDSSHFDNFASSPPSFWQGMHGPKMQIHDSGYFDESFESELSWNSPICNSSSHLRGSQRQGRHVIMGKGSPSFNENAMLTPYDENSLVPIPYRENLRQLKPGPLNFESPLHQPRYNNHHPFRILQPSERSVILPLPPPGKYKAPKRHRKVVMSRHRPY